MVTELLSHYTFYQIQGSISKPLVTHICSTNWFNSWGFHIGLKGAWKHHPCGFPVHPYPYPVRVNTCPLSHLYPCLFSTYPSSSCNLSLSYLSPWCLPFHLIPILPPLPLLPPTHVLSLPSLSFLNIKISRECDNRKNSRKTWKFATVTDVIT